MVDPAEAAVRINMLSRQLNDLMAMTSQPDIKRLAEVTTELRLQANLVRTWAFEREGRE